MNESMQLMALGSFALEPLDGARGAVPVGYPASRWAIFDIDWGTGKEVWAKARPQNCSEMMVKQLEDMAASVTEKPSVPKRYMTYRNFVKALPLLTPVREIMNDARFDVWFVNFSSDVQANHAVAHVPVCESNMTLCKSTGGWSCPMDAVLQPPRCSHL